MRVAAEAEARLAQLARITYAIAWYRRVVEAELIAVVHGRRAAQREEQHGGDARLLLAKPSGDAWPVMVAQNPVGPAAGRQGVLIPRDQRDEIARIPRRVDERKIERKVHLVQIVAIIVHHPLDRQVDLADQQPLAILGP